MGAVFLSLPKKPFLNKINHMIWEKKKKPPEAPTSVTPGTESLPQGSDPVEPARSSRTRFIFQILVILALLLVSFSGPFMQSLGNYLVLEDSPQRADLIVVLAGSPAVRGVAAADYYNQELAPKIYLSRGGLEQSNLLVGLTGLDLTDTGNWGLTKDIMTAKGVPESAVTVDTQFVDSTLAEARRFDEYRKTSPVKKIILVTSRYHSRRAFQTFSHVLGPDVEIISLPSQYDPFQADGWWGDRSSFKNVVLEYQKMLLFRIETWKE
jgi:uncharacterized SAM-binding protein YcdF (DUF218 family)